MSLLRRKGLFESTKVLFLPIAAISPNPDQPRTDRQHYGLGLSVAKELVQLHGGTIGLEDAEGGGARFWVYLPGRG